MFFFCVAQRNEFRRRPTNKMANTRLWGPSAWTFLFSVAYGFDVNDDYPTAKAKAKKYTQFFKTIPDILPCIYCRESARKSFRKRKISQFISKYKKYPLLHYVYTLKDDVNRKLINQEKQLSSKSVHSKNCTRSSPPFSVVLKGVLKMRAKSCSSKNGSCHVQKQIRNNKGKTN